MQLAQALAQPKEVVEAILAELIESYSSPRHGLSIREVAGGFKMSTKPEFHEDIRSFVKKLKPPLKLSLAALETLAVVAYKQPVTGPEILDIRGVQGGGVLKTLLERKLITAAGRKQVVGKPVLYKTTKDFLVQFGLKDLAELPTLKEFEEWSRLALGDDAGETPAAIEPEAAVTAEGAAASEAPAGVAVEEQQEEEAKPDPAPAG
jgi:segregation and condensation protein B